MAVTVKWSGLEEFRAQLRQLPDHLQDQAAVIVVNAAKDAQQEVRAAYPQGPTGNLKRGVGLTIESQSRLGARAIVRSNAKHSHLFEDGTEQRHTKSGANRGRMPEAPIQQQMIPIVIRVRRRMIAALMQMVEDAGLTVSPS